MEYLLDYINIKEDVNIVAKSLLLIKKNMKNLVEKNGKKRVFIPDEIKESV